MSKNVIIILGCITLLFGSGIGMYFFLKYSNQSISSEKAKNNKVVDRSDNEACKLFEKDAIAAAFGRTFVDRFETNLPSYGPKNLNPDTDLSLITWGCNFSQTDEDESSVAGQVPEVEFIVTIVNFANETDVQEYIKTYGWVATKEVKSADGSMTDLSGIGDRVYFADVDTSTSQSVHLIIQESKKLYRLTVLSKSLIDKDTVRTGLIRLAQTLPK